MELKMNGVGLLAPTWKERVLDVPTSKIVRAEPYDNEKGFDFPNEPIPKSALESFKEMLTRTDKWDEVEDEDNPVHIEVGDTAITNCGTHDIPYPEYLTKNFDLEEIKQELRYDLKTCRLDGLWAIGYDDIMWNVPVLSKEDKNKVVGNFARRVQTFIIYRERSDIDKEISDGDDSPTGDWELAFVGSWWYDRLVPAKGHKFGQKIDETTHIQISQVDEKTLWHTNLRTAVKNEFSQ